MLGYVAVSFAFGGLYSVVVVKFFQEVSARRPWRAARYDAMIGIIYAIPLQAWAMSNSSPLVLAAEIVGSALGTFVAVRYLS